MQHWRSEQRKIALTCSWLGVRRPGKWSERCLLAFNTFVCSVLFTEIVIANYVINKSWEQWLWRFRLKKNPVASRNVFLDETQQILLVFFDRLYIFLFVGVQWSVQRASSRVWSNLNQPFVLLVTCDSTSWRLLGLNFLLPRSGRVMFVFQDQG